MQAKDLPKSDTFGLSDPFAELVCETQTLFAVVCLCATLGEGKLEQGGLS